MIEAVIRALIYICVLVVCGLLVLWVLGALGIAIPAQIVTIFWIIVGLIAVLVLFRLLRPHVGNLFP